MARKIDPEMAEFEAAVLRSIEQAQRGEYAAVHPPAEIQARKRGRPAGSVKANPKVATNIRLSPDVLAYFRATGEGWQSLIDGALKTTSRGTRKAESNAQVPQDQALDRLAIR